ncbi:MAG: transketolase [Christensenella sp.]
MKNETQEDTVIRLQTMARTMRLKALEMALGAGKNGAHLGPAFSCMEIFAVLYGEVMRVNAKEPFDIERDRFIPSKAHCVLAYYTALWQKGFISTDELNTFEHNGSNLAGHPVMDVSRGFEYTGGSLGMAMGAAIGMALDAKYKNRKNKTYVLLGDGELDEGSNWEAFLAAPHFKLDNLTAIVDKNVLQYDGTTDEVMSLGDLQAKLTAFGWNVTKVDGHDVQALLNAFDSKSADKPNFIIADTVKGKGVSFMENIREWHHGVLSQQQFEQAVAEVTGVNQ